MPNRKTPPAPPVAPEISLSLPSTNSQTAPHLVPANAGKPHLLKEGEATDSVETGQGESVTAEAAEAFIEGRRIGDRIKFLRQRKGMGLVELGRYTGLSASFLSQLETGRVVPTLRNLARIAMVFSKDLSYFFEPEPPELFRLVRASERQRLPQTGAEDPAYFFEALGQVPGTNPIAPYVAEFLPEETPRPLREHQHAGAEFLYILDGTLEIRHGGRMETLETGDAVYFHSDSPHSYRAAAKQICHALIVTMPELPRGVHSGSRIPFMRNVKFAEARQRAS